MATKSATVQASAGLARAGQKAYAQKWGFFVVFGLVFFTSITVLGALDLLPEPKVAATGRIPSLVAAPVAAVENPEYPTGIEIPSIGVEASVENPASTNIAALDAALLKGAVRYPSSSKLGEEGNLIIFGHSSYLPVVRNQAFKAFNGIQKLEKGEEIIVTSGSRAYVYAVTSVREAKAGEDAIPLTASGHTLTLATCDSFGEKSDRFIVTAELKAVRSL